MLADVLLHERVRAADLVHEGKAANARLDRDEDDLRVGQRLVHLLIERGELGRDLFRRWLASRRRCRPRRRRRCAACTGSRSDRRSSAESAASDPPKPRLIALAPSSGKDSGRFHRTMLDAPMKTMPFCGGGEVRSAASNFAIVSSHTDGGRTSRFATVGHSRCPCCCASSVNDPAASSTPTPMKVTSPTQILGHINLNERTKNSNADCRIVDC